MNRTKYLKYFESKNCIVTGASSGIGRLLAKNLAKYGANVLLVARREPLLQESVEECKCIASEHGHTTSEITYYIADVSDETHVTKMMEYCKVNIPNIDILVTNAGKSMYARIEETYPAIYKQMMNANFYSVVYPIIKGISWLKKNDTTIVVISSIQSLIGVPNQAAYSASKHAVSGFLEALELEEPYLNIVEIMTGWVSGTNIRNNALNGQGKPSQIRNTHIQRHSRSSITVEACVYTIMDSIIKKQRQVYRPKFWKNILFVKYSMRNFLHKMIKSRENKSS